MFSTSLGPNRASFNTVQNNDVFDFDRGDKTVCSSSLSSVWCVVTLHVSAWPPAPGGGFWRWACDGLRGQMEASPPHGTHTSEVGVAM